MEPSLPSPQRGPERPLSPAQNVGVGNSETFAPQQPEAQAQPQVPEYQRGVEAQEATEQRPGQFDNSGQPLTTAQPVPPLPPPLVDQNAVADPAAIVPATAADEDLIEKEWVDKAKKVIAETKHDPYLQEQAVSRLQADYLQKRYGKTIKLSGE